MLAVGGAITGSITCVAIVGSMMLHQGGISGADLSVLGFPALIGALGGFVIAPIAGWTFFRHVPLGRTALVVAACTLVGAVTGEWIAPLNIHLGGAPGLVIGAGVGFLLGAALTLQEARKRWPRL